MKGSTYKVTYLKRRLALGVAPFVFNLPGVGSVSEGQGLLNVELKTIAPEDLPEIVKRRTRGAVQLELVKRS